MNDKIFIDTNILVYAYNLQANIKAETARDLIKLIWENENGVISMQVIQEFYVILTKKIRTPLLPQKAIEMISRYFAWQVVENNKETLIKASQLEEKYRIPFRDAHILAAAIQGHADLLLTENLPHGKEIESVLIENPFTE